MITNARKYAKTNIDVRITLDGGYTVFGQTVEGFDVLDKISSVETVEGSDGAMSKPKTDIIISSVKIFNA